MAHVIAPADFGGAESVVRALCEGRHQAGYPVMAALILQDENVAPLASALERAGVHVAEVRCGRRRYWSEVRALSDALRAWGATLVHTHVYHADVVGHVAARRCGLPVVGTVHGYTGGTLGNRMYERVDRWFLRRFDGTIVVADKMRTDLEAAGVRPERLHVVRNGVAPQSFQTRAAARQALGIPEGGPVVGWVGRLSPEKGPDQFVRAMAALDVPAVRGVLVGDGPERAATLASIAASGVDVRCLGRQPEAGALLKAFDVLALTSRSEGTPIVLLEAMAARVPVVSFAVGGIPAVVDEDSAWLVAPGDVRGAAAGIRAALTDLDEARRRTDAAARRLDAEFGLDRWVQAVEAVYDAVERDAAPRSAP